MIITDIIKIGSQGRMPIGRLFVTVTSIPNYVRLTIDSDLGGIIVSPCKENDDSAVLVDERTRIFLPAWLRHQLPKDCKEFFVVIVDGQKILTPKTSPIPWAEVPY